MSIRSMKGSKRWGLNSIHLQWFARENGPKIAYFKGVDNVVLELFEKA